MIHRSELSGFPSKRKHILKIIKLAIWHNICEKSFKKFKKFKEKLWKILKKSNLGNITKGSQKIYILLEAKYKVDCIKIFT